MRLLLPYLWFLTFFLSLVAWGYWRISVSKTKGIKNRRRITGCEFVCRILNEYRASRMSVKPVALPQAAHFNSRLGEIYLPEKIYYGTQLSELTMALHGTTHLLQEHNLFIPEEFWARGSRFLGIPVFVSWILLGVGLTLTHFAFLVSMGQILFTFVFLLTFVLFVEEGKVTSYALADLERFEEFDPEERTRMRKLLKAIQWAPLAELFESPLTLFIRGKGESKKLHAVSKFS